MRSATRDKVGSVVTTALGEFVLEATPSGLYAVWPVVAAKSRNGSHAESGAVPQGVGEALAHLRAAVEALRRYADGEPIRYPGPLSGPATAFQRAVWERLRAIPFGATATYGQIASELGVPGEAQAVGAAVGANRSCVLVPCHRVVGADGSLRGFAWGIDLKRRLLAHEGLAAMSLFDARPTGLWIRPRS